MSTLTSSESPFATTRSEALSPSRSATARELKPSRAEKDAVRGSKVPSPLPSSTTTSGCDERGDELRAEVPSLQQQIQMLTGDLAVHRHSYQTGKGKGHNNISATSGSAVIPDSP